jgi:RNA polymerase sigma-70 factor (ECF subfamily)
MGLGATAELLPERVRQYPSTAAHVDRDHALIAALRRADPRAAERLVEVYGARAYGLAMRITRNAQDAEEIVQDALLTVARKIDTFRGEAAFGSWLYRIVANAAYQKARGRRRHHAEISLDEILPTFHEAGEHALPIVDWSPAVEDPERQTELRDVLNAALDALPEEYRAVIVLRDVEGLSNDEVAEALHLTVANVKTRVHRGRLFLRKRLADYASAA